MSVDSKVFVEAEFERAPFIGSHVVDNINNWLRRNIAEEVERLGYNGQLQFLWSKDNEDEKGNKKWSLHARLHANDFYTYQIAFNAGGESRTLWYFTTCSPDTDELTTNYTLNFWIGCWGKNEEIMQVVIEALKPHGKVWYDHNDCDDEDYILQN
jgi:hypothetical protein